MYKLITLEHTVRIPPHLFGHDLEDAAFEILSEEFNGRIMEGIGFVIVVSDIIEIGPGKILHGQPVTFHPVKFTVLSYMPQVQEVVEGTVVETVEFGAFIRLGPSDGLCHVSQFADDFFDYDNMAQKFTGKESQQVLIHEDKVRARIIAVSIGSGRAGKLGLTMRQPYLGKLEWIEDELEEEDEAEK